MTNCQTHASYRLIFLFAAALALIATIVPAGAVERLQDQPVTSGRAFSVVRDAGKIEVDLAELSTLPRYRLLTDSPWEEGRQEFEGVLLRDVLDMLKMSDASAVIIHAVDNYSQRIPREDWQDYPTLLALRADGAFLGRREQGPTRLVYPVLDHPELDNPVHKNRWVWLIETVERVD
ncbi:MAG: molybdopterin-dependent oxidoreductase [Alphaproteobacteria bacterium]|nr:molybdopterin-dependent oxidoreductase [Alphaproteobacteria bacterium]